MIKQYKSLFGNIYKLLKYISIPTFSLIIISIFIFISIFAYYIIPQNTSNSNEIELSLANKPPGFHVNYLFVKKNIANKSSFLNKLFFGENDELIAEVIDNTTSRGRTLRFLYDGTHEEFKETLNSLGKTPLPSFIKREPTAQDTERYQTVFAKNEGAVAAPTAGMHLSKTQMLKMQIKGIDFSEITLHVGLGTFHPIMVEDLSFRQIFVRSI